MARDVRDIAVLEYDGPQGSVELETVESVRINRTKPKNRRKTMRRLRRSGAIAMQTGMQEVQLTLTVVPERTNPEVDWQKAWDDEEIFTLTAEKGIDGDRELFIGCEVSDINDDFNAEGEATLELTIEALQSVRQPAA